MSNLKDELNNYKDKKNSYKYIGLLIVIFVNIIAKGYILIKTI